jgi:hypothetical protein
MEHGEPLVLPFGQLQRRLNQRRGPGRQIDRDEDVLERRPLTAIVTDDQRRPLRSAKDPFRN